MKIFGYCLLIFGLMAKTYGLLCHKCEISNFNGESTDSTDCLLPVVNSTRQEKCSDNSNGNVYYCRTEITIYDGVVSRIRRGCQASNNDEDMTDLSKPGSDKCITDLNAGSNPSDTTKCYFHCATDNCNTRTTTFLKTCTNKCENHGACNYITGNCQCTSGFSGPNCTASVTKAQRKCVQCNSATDSGCVSSKTITNCPGSQIYCSTATTNILEGDKIVQTVTTRGCSSRSIAVDRCSFTSIYTDSPISDTPPGYKEFTCFSTCDTDGCNTNTADGVITENEKVTLQCVQCNDQYGGGGCNTRTTRQPCPIGSTHCKSTVVYLISHRSDILYDKATPTYQLDSVVRDCAMGPVNPTCDETNIAGLSLKKVTCTETCQEDGCNTGWPARPKCITCDTGPWYTVGYDECLENPPFESDCSHPYEAYCVLRHAGIEKGKRKGVRGYPHRISRGCSYYDIGNKCASKTIHNTTIENCNRTCDTDGCNVGIGTETAVLEKPVGSSERGANMPHQSVIALAMSTVFGWRGLLNI